MYTATLTETFHAVHHLDTLRPEPHSHDWVLRVTLSATDLQPPGIILNYFELKPLVHAILPHGKDLNAEFDFAPTAENLARHFYHVLKPQLPQLQAVAVGEFESFMCTYQPASI